MPISPSKPRSLEERLELLETEYDAQLTALQLGLAWLMAKTYPVEASVYLQQQAQELEQGTAPDSPHRWANEALGAALNELADQLDAFRALLQSAESK